MKWNATRYPLQCSIIWTIGILYSQKNLFNKLSTLRLKI